MSANANAEPRTSNLTAENFPQIPSGPSNLVTYLQRDEVSERIALGQPTGKSPETITRELEELERRLSDIVLNME